MSTPAVTPSDDKGGRAVLAVATLAAVVVAATTAFLIADAVAVRWRAADDAERLEVLEEQVRTDAATAGVLAAERERQTERSLVREARNHRLGWVLLVSASVFLAAAKWARAVRGRPLPAVAALVQLSSATGRRRGLGPEVATAGAVAAPGTATEPAEPEVDLAVVDRLVAQHGRDREAAIPILQAIQARFRYLPDAAMRRLCELTHVDPAQLAGTATFYARFRSTPVGQHLVRLCHGTACHVAGVAHVDDELRRQLGIPAGDDTDPRRRFTLEPVACLGCCSLAPVLMVGDETSGHLTPATAHERLLAATEVT